MRPPPTGLTGRSAARRLAVRLARSADVRALVALAAVCAAFFAPVLSGRYFLPQGGGDLASFLWPMYRFIAGRLAAGDIPLWNPHQYAGAPLLADNQSGMLYPPFVAFWLLKPAFSYVDLERVVIGHSLFAGVAMYACLRGWGRGGCGGGGGDGGRGAGEASGPARCFAPTAALVGALAWMLNDVFITHLGNLNFNAAASWLPLAMLGLQRACERPTGPKAPVGAGLRPALLRPTLLLGQPLAARIRPTNRATAWLALAAVALGCSALAGHAQATFLCAAAVAAYAVWRAVADRAVRPLAALAAVGAFAFALAAPALLPALALRSSTVRATYDYATSLQYSLPPRALVGLVAPWWWGRGAAAFTGAWDRVEVGYVGVVPLVLALAALATGWRRRDRNRDVMFFGALAIIALLVALGPATPVHRWLIGPLHLPFRAPARYLLLVDFALAWLAAAGAERVADALVRRAERRSSSLHDEQTTVPWRRVAALSGAILVLATAVDLVALGAGVEIDRSDPTAGFWRTAAREWLVAHGAAAAPSPSSVPTDPSQAQAIVADEGNRGLGDLSPPRIDEATGAWQPGAAQLWGLYSLGGVYNPSRLGTYSFAMDGLEYRGSPLYNRFGVAWCLTDKGAAPSDRGRWTKAFAGDPAVDVWRNDAALPRVRVVRDARVGPDDAAVFEAVRGEHDSPRYGLWLVASDLARDAAARAAVDSVDPNPEALIDPFYGRWHHSATVIRYTPDEIVLDVAAEVPAFVVLTDIWHPDWHAAVDGAPAPLLRADFTFRAVAVPSGPHRVVMSYRPRGWRLGLALAAAAWAALAAVAVASGRAYTARRRAAT